MYFNFYENKQPQGEKKDQKEDIKGLIRQVAGEIGFGDLDIETVKKLMVEEVAIEEAFKTLLAETAAQDTPENRKLFAETFRVVASLAVHYRKEGKAMNVTPDDMCALLAVASGMAGVLAGKK